MAKFLCGHCGVVHKNVHTGKNPKVVMAPWFADEKGLHHYAAGCLHCGTINDVAPSFGMFIGKGWTVFQSLPPAVAIDIFGKNLKGDEIMDLPKIVAEFLLSTPHYS